MKRVCAILLSPLAFVRLILLLFLTAVTVFTGALWYLLFGFSPQLQHRMEKNWGKCALLICGFSVSRNEIPRTNNFILMPNHRSYVDIFIVAALVPSSMVGKAELAAWPFGKLAIRATHSILVDRNNSGSLLHTMRQIKNTVAHGIPVTLFPEGTTFKGPLSKSFKNGSFKIAAEGRIPVIPMAIEYHDKSDAWIGKETFVGHFFRQMWKPVRKVHVRFGHPVQNTDYKKLQSEVKAQIDTLLIQLQDL